MVEEQVAGAALPRILFLAARSHFDVAGGESHRRSGLLSALRQHYEVKEIYVQDIMSGAKFSVPQKPKRILSLIPRWAQGISKRQRQFFTEAVSREIDQFRPSVIILYGPKMLPWLRKPLGIPTILDSYDLYWVYTRRRFSGVSPSLRSKLRAALETQVAQWYETRKYALLDEIWVCSEREMDLVHASGHRGRVRVVPNFFVPSPALPKYTSCQNRLLFVGSMWVAANRNAMNWFLTHCWKAVRGQIPDAKTVIIGQWSDAEPPGPEYAQQGVEVRGFVEDLAPVWQESDVFICPLQLGTGTRIKIIEAWSRGLPVVSTSVGIEGLAAIPGRHALVEDDPQKFAGAVVRLLRDSRLREQIGAAGYQLMRAVYTIEHVGALAARYCWELIAEQNCRR